MNQNYTITVAGIDLNVLSDRSAESVETVVASLDRKMREIFLHSPTCSKNEAALLCALEYCASHMAEEEHLAELEENSVKYQAQIANLTSENERLKAALDKLLTEKREAEAAAKNAAEQGTADGTEPGATVTRKDVAGLESAASDKAKKGRRSRVGNMFDLLTFSDDV